MSNDASGDAGPLGDEKAKMELYPYLHATMDDLSDLDFEAPIASSISADSQELSERFRAAITHTDQAIAIDTPTNRVFCMLWAITGMHFRPRERSEPFGPMFLLTDGRRTAIPSDFRGAPTGTLAEMAKQAKNPVLRARLADVSWLLDRKRADLSRIAIKAYTEIVQKVENGELSFAFENAERGLNHSACEYLRRALTIGQATGADKAETVAARDVVIALQKRAFENRALSPVYWFGELDLQFGVSNPADLGKKLDEILTILPVEVDVFTATALWKLAAQAYHIAKKYDDKFRCLSAAAECWVSDAENMLTKPNSAALAASALGTAITWLHPIPNKKSRRTELRHRLVDIQTRIPEELTTFSHKIDLRDIVETTENAIARMGLVDKLFVLACFSDPPSPNELICAAEKTIRENPLSSYFPTVHLDVEGKVTHRSDSASLGDDANDPQIRRQITQDESIRRHIIAHGQIEIVRVLIMNQHFLSDETFEMLLRYSPFVPNDLVATFSRGFLRFFQGDFVSATYILTPLLENSLRHVLKSFGHDVSIFDDDTQTQKDRTISQLFTQMRKELEEVFTEATIADIYNVFLSRPGPCLRHSVAHGLLSDGSPYGPDAIYGCTLIFRLCLLPLYPQRERLQLVLE